VIFSRPGIPTGLASTRALFWGIARRALMRAIMIGSASTCSPLPLGSYSLRSGARVRGGTPVVGEEAERKHRCNCNLCTSWVARFVPLAPSPRTPAFLVAWTGGYGHPLLVALVAIEAGHLVFAVTRSPPVACDHARSHFLVYTSNVFALFGLRSLYFYWPAAMQPFVSLRTGLAIIPAVRGRPKNASSLKQIEIPPAASLAVIACIFLGSSPRPIYGARERRAA